MNINFRLRSFDIRRKSIDYSDGLIFGCHTDWKHRQLVEYVSGVEVSQLQTIKQDVRPICL